MEVLTIIEEPPKTVKKPRYDPAIESFVDWFRKRERKFDVRRAHSLITLGDVLSSVSSAYDTIQIIGHGIGPGVLSMGQTWLRSSESAYKNDGAVYQIDSNPNAYSTLRGSLGTIREVYLVGCSVGENDVQPSILGVNGDTLLIDLSQMWGCSVSAPPDLVAVKSLDPISGLYAGPSVVWHWVQGTPRRKMRPGTRPIFRPVFGPRIDSPVQFTKLLAAPVLGPRNKPMAFKVPARGAEKDDIGSQLSAAFMYPVRNMQPLLASPELVFEVRWHRKIYQANLICNHRFLELLEKNGHRNHVVATLGVLPDQPDRTLDVGVQVLRLLKLAFGI